jgi:hypothetical protein
MAMIAGLAPAASASTLYQSIPDLTVPAYGYFVSNGVTHRVFDTFTLGSNSTVQSVTFAIEKNFSNAGVSIWSIASGFPGTQLFSQYFTRDQFASAVGGPSDATEIVTVNLASLSLNAGTYDISFYNPTNLDPLWVALFVNAGGQAVFLPDPIGQVPAGRSAGFILNGTTAVAATPLPAALPLLVSALGGLGFVGWRRRKAEAA